MNEIIIEIEGEHFLATFENIDGWYDGKVYPIQFYTDANNNEGWSYTSKIDSNFINTLTDECRVLFDFTFVYRGVFEGRIYFKDDEYWSEELRSIYLLWEVLEDKLKTIITEINPSHK